MTPEPPIIERLPFIRELYESLKPGEEKRVSAMCLDQPTLDYYLSGCNSGYTLGYRFPNARPDDFKYWVLFYLDRSLKSNIPDKWRSYVDPDRRHLYDYQYWTGIYIPKNL